jgi:2-methylcitrate dehydratase PrpD
MDCALKLKQEYSPAPEKIAKVICRTAQGPVHRLWEPLADKQKPVSSYGAKFSLPYSIAVMLVRGRAGLDEFTEEAIHEPIVLGVAKKVRYALDPTIDYPRHFPATESTLDDGPSWKRISAIHAAVRRSAAPQEIEEKFRANARLALPKTTVERISETVRQLERLPAISQLTDHLVP